ncbi:MAG: EAL domain-containing protein [Brevundimonas sp.]|uniref:bifunctional diguanylate cyclase/phosphodiesterase n=1 Tax=Brevundimonas sp. TaxID=1871086 RepID=UPI0025C54DB9|nr:EAL domain-containing protein [Brevundimonas sp.]MBX3477153.1 EAL domain-containing protein [Brevundimonas sp.]
MRFLSCLVDQHDHALTLLAAVICLIGSLVTIRMFRRVRAASTGARPLWALMGGVAGGATIWCTHFVAMLAYRPGVDVAYEPRLTALSLVLAMIGSYLVMSIGARRNRRAPALAGGLFGVTVTMMHYTGMAAFTSDAIVYWSPIYVTVSVIAAIMGGVLAFDAAARFGAGIKARIGALLLVVAIVALHFTGMAAMTVLPLAPLPGTPTGEEAQSLLAMAVAAIGFLIMGISVVGHMLDDQSRRQGALRLNQLIDSTVDGMVVEGPDGVIMANGAFAELSGLSMDIIRGGRVAQWIDSADSMDSGLVQSELRTRDGALVPVEVAVRTMSGVDINGQVRVFAVRDLRMRLAQERRIAHLARNDSLTELPNRASFLEKLERQAALADDGDRFALFAIDLNRFKEINDIYGHAIGDRLLVHVAEQMRAAARQGEFLARLGGDEFVAIVPVEAREEALTIAERLREAIIAPVMLEGVEIGCGASIGIAFWPDDAQQVSDLVNNADLAMYRAKASLTTDVCFYESAMDQAVRERRRMTLALRETLDAGRFELHYQVQASVESGRVIGYEALLRWPQADGGYISPEHFIPLAEETGLILPIDEWVLRTACAEAAAWPEPHKIAVNLSPVQLSHVDLPRLVHQVLLETGLAPSRLELEITETAMITDLERTIHVLRQLKALGVSIAMDDFGTGYSSLSTLRAFPFDKIKLDRSFMSELDGSPQARAIIRAVLTLGESLDIPVLAEGVETPGQLDFLREQGCDEVQGFLLGRPGPRKTATPDATAEAAA